MTERSFRRTAGIAAGMVNGLFGGGGGMVLAPALTKWGGLSQHAAFATCLASILPMCAVSALVYYVRVRPDLSGLLPYLLGGAIGGVVAGLTFRKVPVRVLKLILGLFLLWGGVRYLL